MPPLKAKEPFERISESITETLPVMVMVAPERLRVSILNPLRAPGKLVLPDPVKLIDEPDPPVMLPEVLLIDALFNVSRFGPIVKAPLVRYRVPVIVLPKEDGSEIPFELLMITFGGPADEGHSAEVAVWPTPPLYSSVAFDP